MNAPSEVNLSAAAMEEVHRDLKNPSRYSFTAAKVREESSHVKDVGRCAQVCCNPGEGF